MTPKARLRNAPPEPDDTTIEPETAPFQLHVRGVPPGSPVGKTFNVYMVMLLATREPKVAGNTAAGLAAVAREGQVRPLLRDGKFDEARTTQPVMET
jgi:hypothetical protein